MKQIITLAINDFKHVFRDRMLCIFLLAPVILVLFARYFVPYLASVYPIVKDYYLYIMMFGAIQTSIMFGFISGFIILEEKDDNVLQAIRVLPISPVIFIVYRLLFAMLFSTIAAYLMIVLAGLAWPGNLASILLSLHYGLAAPFIALIVATYAKNKIEGLAYFKGVDVVIIIPIVGLFLSGGWEYVFSFVPMFWTYEMYDEALKSGNIVGPFIAGICIYALSFILLIRQFKQKVF